MMFHSPSTYGLLLSLLLLLISQIVPGIHSLPKGSLENVSDSALKEEAMVPMLEDSMTKMDISMFLDDSSRRKLGSFQICAACTCCGGGVTRVCLPSPCCYAINCNIPNRPFGFCSFTPKTCNCFGCHL